MCMVEQPNYYSVIPASVRYDKDISPLAKLLYSEITALSNKEGYCWASNKYFAELYGKSETWISLTIKKLEQKGYVKSEVNRIKGNERKIKIVDPPIYVKLKTSLSKVKDPSLSKVKDNNININNKYNITSPVGEGASSQKRKNIVFPKKNYTAVIEKYQSLKGITLQGKEFEPVQQSIKTMFMSQRAPNDIIACMQWLAAGKEPWMANWTIDTVKKKLPEFMGQNKSPTYKKL